MARTPTAQQIFDELIKRYEKDIADALATAFQDLRDKASITQFISALSENDLEGAIRALNLDPAAFGPVDQAIQRAFTAGGQFGAAQIGAQATRAGLQFVIRFDGRNIRAENWLRDHSSTQVTRIIDDQRTAVRTALQAGMEAGANPRTTALDIVGRIDKALGRRTGGIIGLSGPQADFVAAARAELASGDPARLRNYLTRARRDRRFDATVRAAIGAGKPVDAATASKMVDRYSDSLLKLRGDTVGRTEALASLHTAQHEAMQQAIDAGHVTAQQVRRTWRTAGDNRVRHTHQGMNGETVGMTEAFQSPSGARLMYPGDTSLGAGPAETINCRCVVSQRVDYLSNLR